MLIDNKLEYSINRDALSARYAVFCVRTSLKYFKFQSLALDTQGASTLGVTRGGKGEGNAFYILANQDATQDEVKESVLRRLEHRRADEQVDQIGIRDRIRVTSENLSSLDDRLLLRLLANALPRTGNPWNGASNVTGRLLLLPSHAVKDKQVTAIEVEIDTDLRLQLHTRTFTNPDARGLSFSKKHSKESYARYAVSLKSPAHMRRAEEDDKQVYIERQFPNVRNRSIPFLSYASTRTFNDSKCGMARTFLSRFNEAYAGVAHLELRRIHEEDRLTNPVKGRKGARDELAQVNLADWYRNISVAFFDETGESPDAWKHLKNEMCNLIKKDEAKGDAAGAIVLIHEKPWYEERHQNDPHAPLLGGVVRQHVTVEQLGEIKTSLLAEKLLWELAMKLDVVHRHITTFDWASLKRDCELQFALPIYSEDAERGQGPDCFAFMTIDPEGAFSFTCGDTDPLVGENAWDELAADLADKWTSTSDGAIIDGDEICRIERTGGFPFPALDAIKDDLDNSEWVLPKVDVMDILRICEENSDPQGAFERTMREVRNFPDEQISHDELRAMTKTAAAETGISVRTINRSIDQTMRETLGLSFTKGVPRGSERMDTTYDGLLRLNAAHVDGELVWWVGSFQGSLVQGGYTNTPAMRRLVCDGDSSTMEDLFATLSIPFVRMNEGTVVPFPFKYLREWMEMKRLQP